MLFKQLRVIIAGGRKFDDYTNLIKECDEILLPKIIDEGYCIEIVSGTANGTDKLGERYAKLKQFGLSKFPANWDKFGKSAGYKRNSQMGDYSDVLIAFWDGESRGTKHMIDLATSKGLEVFIIKY